MWGHGVHSQTVGVLGTSEGGNPVAGIVNNPDNPHAAVAGVNYGQGKGVIGFSVHSHGVQGVTGDDSGDFEFAGVFGSSTYTRSFGVLGTSQFGTAVEGVIHNPANLRPAVVGWNQGSGQGVAGFSGSQSGVYGELWGAPGMYNYAGVQGFSWYTRSFGVLGESDFGIGVEGRINNPENTSPATSGFNAGSGVGVSGHALRNTAVEGFTESEPANWLEHAGVRGSSIVTNTPGVLGTSDWGNGVVGSIGNPDNKLTAVLGRTDGLGPAVAGIVDNISSTAPALMGWNNGAWAGVVGHGVNNYGVFGESDVTYGVATPNGMLAPSYDVGMPDVAEYFPTSGPGLRAGDVVVIDSDASVGFVLRRADRAYDTAVAGIVSTEPGITLGVRDGDIMPGSNEGEVPLALVGRVPCNVDASYGPIAAGDLLTSSPTPGRAMVCTDRLACVGAVIGKALEPLQEGTGRIMVLVTLQ